MRKHIVPGLLVACTLLVAFWIVASQRYAKPFKPFNLTHADFAGYCPVLEGSLVKAVVLSSYDPAEPNIAAFGVEQGMAGDGPRLSVRLVHGYNMPMCMKIKGYTVEGVVAQGLKPGVPVQFWRVTSSAGEVSIWATTMIRSDDFSVTPVEVTSMAFPRVDVPDDPNWVPRGFTRDDLRHPVQSLRLWFRARWNASRTDPLTFLRLRQPAWASEELLTYVSRSIPPSVSPDREQAMILSVLDTHLAMLRELQQWRKSHGPVKGAE